MRVQNYVFLPIKLDFSIKLVENTTVDRRQYSSTSLVRASVVRGPSVVRGF